MVVLDVIQPIVLLVCPDLYYQQMELAKNVKTPPLIVNYVSTLLQPLKEAIILTSQMELNAKNVLKVLVLKEWMEPQDVCPVKVLKSEEKNVPNVQANLTSKEDTNFPAMNVPITKLLIWEEILLVLNNVLVAKVYNPDAENVEPMKEISLVSAVLQDLPLQSTDRQIQPDVSKVTVVKIARTVLLWTEIPCV